MTCARRVAIIGLDGVPPRFIFELWKDQLPNLSALMERGVWGTLRG
jgi:predicted AlkP superfamily phosphohydrolase/phosphomutase